MKVSNEDLDKILNKLIASTRSPRGRFSAENSWKLLESRLFARRIRRRFWLRGASAAAVVVLCVASWAAYHALYIEPTQPKQVPTEVPAPATHERREVMVFRQQPLQEIVDQLSEMFHADIRIEDDSLKNYRMTATFSPNESLTEILDLLKDAGNFDYKQIDGTIIITKLN